jgi:ABC-2 type transport system ATP-binding protein
MNSSAPIIQATNLSRFYGMVLGLNNVNFAIGPGLTGIVGPNGAGKTTLFRLLTGQVKPSSGSLRVFGEEPWNNTRLKARIAYCPEGEEMPAGLCAADWLQGLGMMSGLTASAAAARTTLCLDRVKLERAHRRKPLTSLSKGMRQRVKLAQCVLHDADLLIFDEPMNGLDPMGREDFAQVLRDLAGEGKTLLISSHILQDLEALCAEFLFLRWGCVPASLNDALSPQARRSFPPATTFRCREPQKLAQFLANEGLVRGWDLGEGPDVLYVRWSSPERFFGDFAGILLRSGVSILEVRNTESAIQQAFDAPHLS